MILLNPKTAGKNGSEIYDVQFNNCGLYKDIPLDISVSRKFGRTDHHFIFVISGRFEFDIGDKTHIAENGDVVYIPPNVPHEYCYKSGEGTLYYWVHFSGLSIDKMFETFPFKHGLYHSAQIDNYIEYLCGNYEIGRYAWILKDVKILKYPIKVKGKLGIWNYDR